MQKRTGADREKSRQRARLMAAVQDGEREAYRELLDDIGPLLTRFLRRRIAAEDVEDVYQETLVTMHRARQTYDPSRPLEPWLFAIARNVAIDHNRRRLARTSWEVLVEAPPGGVEAGAGDASERLEEVLARLPAAQREAFELLKVQGLPAEEGAKRVGTSPGALRVRAHRAYRTIRALLRG
jgi:RNA polymerase sigma-70 factor (ECF subfamily)